MVDFYEYELSVIDPMDTHPLVRDPTNAGLLAVKSIGADSAIVNLVEDDPIMEN